MSETMGSGLPGVSVCVRLGRERHDILWSGLQWIGNSNRVFYLVAAVGIALSFAQGFGLGGLAVGYFVLLKLVYGDDGRDLPLLAAFYEVVVWLYVLVAIGLGITYVVTGVEEDLLTFLDRLCSLGRFAVCSYLCIDLMSPPRPRRKIRVPKRVREPTLQPSVL
jgi:hypothetical protein